MSSGKTVNVFESLYKAWTSVSEMLIGDEAHRQRDPNEVLRWIQRLIADPGYLAALEPQAVSLISDACWVIDWQNFYQEVFDLKVDFTGVKIPKEQPGFGWVLMIPMGLTGNQVWEKYQKRFSVFSLYDDLDGTIPTNERTSVVSYAVRCRNRVEADLENTRLSADDLASRKISNITLPERLVLEMKYNYLTGGNLDSDGCTLCAGSRDSDGDVPGVSWNAGEFRVDGYFKPNLVYDDTHARSVLC